MKRSPMTRTTPRLPAEWTGDTLPTARAQPLRIADTRARLTVPIPKRKYLRSESYRRWVASLPCAHCKRAGPSQAAHSDAGADGKGMQIKACDSSIFPLCPDGLGRNGCHTMLGATGTFTRSQQQTLAAQYARATRTRAVEVGSWPAGWQP